jgi:hypothetical protein
MPDWRYYCIMPHIDDDDLDPFQYRLLGHIRRRAGEDGCFSQIKTLAKDTKMCHHKVREALKQLRRKHRITIEKRPGSTHLIVPVDMREVNEKRYAKNGTPSKNGRPPLQDIEHKEITHIRNNPIKKQHHQETPDADVLDFLQKIGIDVEGNRKLRTAIAGARLPAIKALWKKCLSRREEKRLGAMARGLMDGRWREFPATEISPAKYRPFGVAQAIADAAHQEASKKTNSPHRLFEVASEIIREKIMSIDPHWRDGMPLPEELRPEEVRDKKMDRPWRAGECDEDLKL